MERRRARRRRHWRPWWIVVPATLAMAGLTGPSASAHGLYPTAIVYSSEDDCVKLRSEINHNSSVALYARSDIQSLFEGLLGGNCANDWDRPAYQLRNRLLVQYKSGVNWIACTETVYLYNQVPNDNQRDSRSWSASQGLPCGGGRAYRVIAVGSLQYNGVWHGGQLSSGEHGF